MYVYVLQKFIVCSVLDFKFVGVSAVLYMLFM